MFKYFCNSSLTLCSVVTVIWLLNICEIFLWGVVEERHISGAPPSAIAREIFWLFPCHTITLSANPRLLNHPILLQFSPSLHTRSTLESLIYLIRKYELFLWMLLLDWYSFKNMIFLPWTYSRPLVILNYFSPNQMNKGLNEYLGGLIMNWTGI